MGRAVVAGRERTERALRRITAVVSLTTALLSGSCSDRAASDLTPAVCDGLVWRSCEDLADTDLRPRDRVCVRASSPSFSDTETTLCANERVVLDSGDSVWMSNIVVVEELERELAMHCERCTLVDVEELCRFRVEGCFRVVDAPSRGPVVLAVDRARRECFRAIDVDATATLRDSAGRVFQRDECSDVESATSADDRDLARRNAAP